jgi:hypothetical protein
MKIILMPVLAMVAVTAQATDTRRMDMNDLNHFIPDCSRKAEQMRWLESQLPSRWERQQDSLSVTSVGGTIWSVINGTYDQRKNIHDGRTTAVVRSYIQDLERWCPNEPKPAGCITVRDSTNAGASQGQRCHDGRGPKPVIDRWEAVVQ